MNLVRPGDVGVLLAAGALVVGLAVHAWNGPRGDTVVVRAAGRVVETVPLSTPRQLAVAGPLGTTRIEIEAGRARVSHDPSPRQICVRQGWLEHTGQVALCLPNEVSVEIAGRAPAYDTLGY